jgi:4-amino-4-deoxy-L-arabinose transferase-like glycosyltransferase
VRQWQRLACAAIVLLLCAARFVRLNDTPAGFYLDEAAGATTILCLAESGYPLFFEELPGTGTFFTPAYVYSGAVWTKVFGTSIAAFRAHVAFYSILTIVAVFLIARRFLGIDGALLAALAAAVSPWGFQFARIAWDPPLATCLLLWGVAFHLRRSTFGAVLSGLLLAAAMYTYPPVRLHVPLLLVLLWAVERPGVPRAAAQLATMAVACIPLAVLTLNGTLNTRANTLGIWSAAPSAAGMAALFVRNLLAHLSPGFLLFRGDLNPRHGTQVFGILSWLDMLALVAGVALIRRQTSASRRLLLLSAGGCLTAFAVTSLTWEGIPHALRSLAGWPFLALMSGTLLAAACARWRIAPWVILVCAIAFSSVYLYVYFTTYRSTSAGFFDAALREEAEKARQTGNWEPLRGYGSFYPQPALRYYFLHYYGASCKESRRTLSSK